MFQNHKIMHQEILGNHPLITSVCDKTKNLVDQTKDTTLNVFLNSIQELFENIVSKSQVWWKKLYIITMEILRYFLYRLIWY